MRVFNIWDKVFFKNWNDIQEAVIERNNWVNNWTYTIIFTKNSKQYKEIIASWKLFDNEKEVNQAIIDEYKYNIKNKKYYIEQNKKRNEEYEKEIKEIEEKIFILETK